MLSQVVFVTGLLFLTPPPEPMPARPVAAVRCDCGPGCRCAEPPKVQYVRDDSAVKLPAEQSPPQWVIDRMAALEGDVQTLKVKVARIDDGISRIEKLLTEKPAPVAAADPAKKSAEDVLLSIDAKLGQLVAQKQAAPPAPSRVVTAPAPFPAAGFTPGTPAPGVGPPNSFSPGQPAGAVTYTLAPGAGPFGATSGCGAGGCANGACAAPQRGLFGGGGLFGRRR